MNAVALPKFSESLLQSRESKVVSRLVAEVSKVRAQEYVGARISLPRAAEVVADVLGSSMAPDTGLPLEAPAFRSIDAIAASGIPCLPVVAAIAELVRHARDIKGLSGRYLFAANPKMRSPASRHTYC
jgi:hypothetical protein